LLPSVHTTTNWPVASIATAGSSCALPVLVATTVSPPTAVPVASNRCRRISPLLPASRQTTTVFPLALVATWRPAKVAVVSWEPPVVVLTIVSTPGFTMVGASTPAHAACSPALGATAVSIVPDAYSSAQSPPSQAAPVGSTLAATSAPVSRASASTSVWPSGSAARSQPYSSRSAFASSAAPQAAKVLACARIVRRSSVAVPICIEPGSPWAITWIAL
jgi:hypothetical protein